MGFMCGLLAGLQNWSQRLHSWCWLGGLLKKSFFSYQQQWQWPQQPQKWPVSQLATSGQQPSDNSQHFTVVARASIIAAAPTGMSKHPRGCSFSRTSPLHPQTMPLMGPVVEKQLTTSKQPATISQQRWRQQKRLHNPPSGWGCCCHMLLLLLLLTPQMRGSVTIHKI